VSSKSGGRCRKFSARPTRTNGTGGWWPLAQRRPRARRRAGNRRSAAADRRRVSIDPPTTRATSPPSGSFSARLSGASPKAILEIGRHRQIGGSTDCLGIGKGPVARSRPGPLRPRVKGRPALVVVSAFEPETGSGCGGAGSHGFVMATNAPGGRAKGPENRSPFSSWATRHLTSLLNCALESFRAMLGLSTRTEPRAFSRIRTGIAPFLRERVRR